MAEKQQMTLPQIAIASAVGIALLWLVTAFYWMAAGSDSWDRAKRQLENARKEREDQQRLIIRYPYWRDAYEKERERMPEYEEGRDISSEWLRLLDEVAQANKLSIRSRKPIRGNDSETRIGDVCEQQIEVGKWEASLQGLVLAMYAFEKAEGQMIDIRKISIVPNSARKGFMSGNLSLTCAYTRYEPEKKKDRDGGKPAKAGKTGKSGKTDDKKGDGK